MADGSSVPPANVVKNAAQAQGELKQAIGRHDLDKVRAALAEPNQPRPLDPGLVAKSFDGTDEYWGRPSLPITKLLVESEGLDVNYMPPFKRPSREALALARTNANANLTPREGLGASTRDWDEGYHLYVPLVGTALHAATAIVNLDGVRYLLDRGADARIKNSRGKTPLDMAKEHPSRSAIQAVLEEWERTHPRPAAKKS